LLDNEHPPQHRPDIVEKRFTGQRSALQGGPIRAGSSGERGEGITEAARGWVGAGAPRELRYDSRAPVPVTVNRGATATRSRYLQFTSKADEKRVNAVSGARR